MLLREAQMLERGSRVTYFGAVDNRRPDIEPHIGCGGRIISGPDADGDLRVVWDDHAYNDQAYPPGDESSWLYCPHDCIGPEVQVNVANIKDVEAFLNE